MRGYIYKLYHPDYPDFYIGSTVDLEKRKQFHFFDCNDNTRPNYKNKKYQYIRKHSGIENWVFEIIEDMEITERRELNILEEYHIILKNPTLNTNRAMKKYN